MRRNGTTMSVELVKRDDEQDVPGIAKLGTIFHQSGYFRDIRDQSQAVVKILYGRELGFSPVVSMLGVHVIEGKPSLSSNLLGTLVKRSGKYDYRVTESTDKVCTLEFFVCSSTPGGAGKRESLGVSSFSMEDAQRAGLIKPNSGWAKYPRAMMFARALSAGVRLHCPDVSACPLYVPEELGATVNEDGDVQELPKSARPVEVTTEDISIEGFRSPGNSAGAGNKGPAQAPDKDGGHAVTAAPVEAAAAPAESPAVPANDALTAAVLKTAERLAPSEYIGKGESANLHKLFREALNPERRKLSDALLADWLKVQGIVDADGKGSALAIRKTNFFDVRESATQHAHSL